MAISTEQERAECKEAFENARAKEFKRLSEKLDFAGVELFHERQTSEWVIWQQAWQAARRAPVVPQGWKLVPVELLKRAEESIGNFVSDLGWDQCDMDTMDAITAALAAAPQPPSNVQRSATYGMNIGQRILHVGGRENAQTYIEFGSVAAVRALVGQVLRDLPDGCPDFSAAAPQPPEAATVSCACGDSYPANSFGAGFIAARDKCPNCDAAEAAPEPIGALAYSADKSKTPSYHHGRKDADQLVRLLDDGVTGGPHTAVLVYADPPQDVQKDAERYRWLRDICGIVEYKAAFGSIGPGMLPSGENLDAAIDAARAAKGA